MSDTRLAEKLESIVGQRFVLQRPGDLLVYNSDGLPGYRRMPRLAVFPGNRDEAIAGLASAFRRREYKTSEPP